MGDGLGMLTIVLAAGVSLVALFAVGGGLFPRQLAWTRQAAEGQATRSFLVGLVNTVFVIALAMGAGALGEATGLSFLPILSVLLLAILIIGATFGLMGMAELVGERLFPASRPLRRTLVGGAILLLACLAPYVGWFGLFPYTVLRGLGGFILGWFAARARPAPQAAA
ncbi:MAG: hypothetical protein A2Y93_05440 [Chloroflexi bacterium RBG_13_68_17]|nr:MAG: hypothetical protein A2Y93_05440 [Chloroflexi bacterium RBG_13_68_17]